MFGFFPLACGVANVRDFARQMPVAPAFVAPSRGGAGFVEIAERILAGRVGVRLLDENPKNRTILVVVKEFA
jgi:hypothetical protein